MDRSKLVDLIEGNDLDGLVRFVDGLCAAREWDGVVELRDRCRQAVERGKQLWAAAEFAEYRLALEAPGPLAAAVVVEGAGRFTLGPLWEVAASTHPWAELAPGLGAGPVRAMAAHERVVRGEDLTGEGTIDPHVLELPLEVQPWEPAYPVAVYRADKADFPEPDYPPLGWVDLPEPGEQLDDPEALDALYDLVRPWVDQSNGRAETVAVEGGALAAVAALGPSRARVAEVEPTTALAWLAWTGASGGAYGRRRGTPVGRHDAWWAVAALADLEWPAAPAAVAEAAVALRWWRWDPGDAVGGWSFYLAVEDPAEGLAWAISAVDAV